MKKQSLKNLSFNKQTISNFKMSKIKGGTIGDEEGPVVDDDTPPHTEQEGCRCTKWYHFCW